MPREVGYFGEELDFAEFLQNRVEVVSAWEFFVEKNGIDWLGMDFGRFGHGYDLRLVWLIKRNYSWIFVLGENEKV